MEIFSYIGIQFLRMLWGVGMVFGIAMGLIRLAIWLGDVHNDDETEN